MPHRFALQDDFGVVVYTRRLCNGPETHFPRPAGGRNAFSQRVQACFATLNVTAPNDLQLKRIFGTILSAKLADFDDEVKPLSEPITMATIGIYRAVSRELLPTPSKSHYLFNTRDLAKIVQGMMQVGRAQLGFTTSSLTLTVRISIPYISQSRTASATLTVQMVMVLVGASALSATAWVGRLSVFGLTGWGLVLTWVSSCACAGRQGLLQQQGGGAAAVVPRVHAHHRGPHVGPRRQGVAGAPAGREAGLHLLHLVQQPVRELRGAGAPLRHLHATGEGPNAGTVSRVHGYANRVTELVQLTELACRTCTGSHRVSFRLADGPCDAFRCPQNVDLPPYEPVRDMVALKDLLMEKLEVRLA